jgi:hypothetical protein
MDIKTRCTDVFAGFPGFVHDSRVLFCSNHKLFVTNGEKLNEATKEIQGVDFFIGNVEYTAN